MPFGRSPQQGAKNLVRERAARFAGRAKIAPSGGKRLNRKIFNGRESYGLRGSGGLHVSKPAESMKTTSRAPENAIVLILGRGFGGLINIPFGPQMTMMTMGHSSHVGNIIPCRPSCSTPISLPRHGELSKTSWMLVPVGRTADSTSSNKTYAKSPKTPHGVLSNRNQPPAEG